MRTSFSCYLALVFLMKGVSWHCPAWPLYTTQPFLLNRQDEVAWIWPKWANSNFSAQDDGTSLQNKTKAKITRKKTTQSTGTALNKVLQICIPLMVSYSKDLSYSSNLLRYLDSKRRQRLRPSIYRHLKIIQLRPSDFRHQGYCRLPRPRKWRGLCQFEGPKLYFFGIFKFFLVNESLKVTAGVPQGVFVGPVL